MSNYHLITIQAIVNIPVEVAWKKWTTPSDIMKWNNASDWHTPHAENDLRPGGKFRSRMEAIDGSFGFDFEGTYGHGIKTRVGKVDHEHVVRFETPTHPDEVIHG